MYRIIFYKKANGETPLLNYIQELSEDESKSGQIQYNKIAQYIKVLQEKGKQAGEPFIKHLEGEIWELRPRRDRIFFAGIDGKRIVLLHSFMKQTKKTPAKEIEQAKRELADFLERDEQ